MQSSDVQSDDMTHCSLVCQTSKELLPDLTHEVGRASVKEDHKNLSTDAGNRSAI